MLRSLASPILQVPIAVGMAVACSAQYPQFATSERRPHPQAQAHPEPEPIPTLRVPSSEHGRALLVRRLFLTLSLGDQSAVQALLWPNAKIGRANQNLASASKATLSELIALFAQRASPESTDPDPSGVAFAEAHILDVSERHASRSEFSVRVDGPTSIQGNWKVTVEQHRGLRIVEVVLPPEP